MMQTAAMMFSEKDPKHHVDIKQLLIILSDGRGVFSEGETVHICSSIVNVGLTHISAHRHSHYIEKSLYMYTCITSYPTLYHMRMVAIHIAHSQYSPNERSWLMFSFE